MYGFKPQHARGKPVQNFADGGIVHSIKGALGLRPRTSEELLAADAKRMEQNREAAAAIAERNRKAQPAPQQQSAISGYAGMRTRSVLHRSAPRRCASPACRRTPA